MNAEELYELASESPAGQACVPINLQHTAPRLVWREGWTAEFWYYREDDNGGVFAPRYYMSFRLPGGAPLEFRTLEGGPVCLGPAPELLDPAYWDSVNRYLEDCAGLTEAPEEALCRTLAERWSSTLPSPLREWMRVRELEAAGVPTARAAGEPVPGDLPGYWKGQMEAALKAGDKTAYDRAKEQYARTVRN